VVLLGAKACVAADLMLAAVAAGNSDQISATEPVTKAVATLVPPIVSGSSVALRLVISSPGAPSPRLPIEAPRLDRPIGRPWRS
jgi:hypothetical protein